MKKRKKKIGKCLFIEGSTNEENGKLSQGFNKLFNQELAGKMPRIIMGDGKSQAIQKFKKSERCHKQFLLIDLDAPEEEKDKDLKKNDFNGKKDFIFYMIQEMEAWFLAQPEILDDYYNTKLSEKIQKKHSKEINDPSGFLEQITKPTKKGKYHKVDDGTALLELLNAGELKKQFTDFEDLIEKLKK